MAFQAAPSGRTRPSTITILTLAVSVVTAVWAAAMMTPGGRIGYVYVFAYAEFYAGVVTLVALSLTVMTGLIATDRLVLSIRQRVLAQSAHRTAGVIAIAALALHVGTKVAEGHVGAIDAVVPFLAPGPSGVFLGLGTIAGFLMIVVMWTGVARARFAGRGRPWMWRAIHVIAYPMWPLALVHGLAAGRPAAPWVGVSYVLCVLGVLVGLAVRLSVGRSRGRHFAPVPATPSPVDFAAPAPAPMITSTPIVARVSVRPVEASPAPAAARRSRVAAGLAVEPDYPPPDETPTLVDLAGRRARKDEERRRDGTHATAPRARRPRRRADDAAAADVEYWRRIRREAR